MPAEYTKCKEVLMGKGKSEEEANRICVIKFHEIFGISLQKAHELFKAGKWEKWKKDHGKASVRFDQVVPFEVTDDEQRIIEGFLSVEVVDRKGTIISTDAILEAYEEYMALSRGKLRVQHKAVPVGRVLTVEKRFKEVDGQKVAGVWIKAQVDRDYEAAEDTWAMIKAGALEGFSIGFDPLAETFYCTDRETCYPKIIKLRWIETSVVDLPANPLAFIEHIRSLYQPYTMAEELLAVADRILMPTDNRSPEVWICECTNPGCGYEIATSEHCDGLKCPECGGQLRRKGRPGPGKEQRDEFTPPDAGPGAPEGVKDILRKVYFGCRETWVKDHPDDRENQANKTKCAQSAWAAVHAAGWEKTEEGWKKRDLTAEVEREAPKSWWNKCLAAVKEKGATDPEALCAWIWHRLKGEWPAQKDLEPDQVLAVPAFILADILRYAADGGLSELLESENTTDDKKAPKPEAQRQDEAPPAAPGAAPAEGAPPVKEAPTLADIAARLATLEKIVADIVKKQATGGEPAGEAATDGAPSEGAGLTNKGDAEKQLQASQARIKELEGQLAEATGATEPRSQAPGAPGAGPTLDIPDDLREMSPQDIEYLHQMQQERMAAVKKGAAQ